MDEPRLESAAPITAAERAAWIGFSLVKGIGPARFRRLLRHFGAAQTAWQASRSALAAAGLPPATVKQVLNVRRQVDPAALLARWQAAGIRVLTWNDPDYPARLRPLPQSPPVLYVRGALQPEDDWAAAVVGTRKMTAYGRRVATDVATYLARAGVTVVSGLARGIDGVAHRAALEAGGRTLAVLGSGVDRIYPPEHRALARAIVQQGALLSEFPPGTRPEGSHFPRRNRLISGLAEVVIVVEAGERSGALITATFAAEQGREVLVVPGPIYAPTSQGTLWLAQQGAQILRRVEDLAEIFQTPQLPWRQQARRQFPTDPTERLLWQYLQGEPRHVDELCAETGLPAAQVSALLTLLQLKGLVEQVGPMTFVATGPRT